MSNSPRHKARRIERAKKIKADKNKGIGSPLEMAMQRQREEGRVLRAASLIQGLGLGGVAGGEIVLPISKSLEMMDKLR
jgi:hypothetical protein